MWKLNGISTFFFLFDQLALIHSSLVPPPLQFDNEHQFNSSVKTLLSRLPRQRYLKSICDELHQFKIVKK